ncbi:MAG: NAD(P)/FAD-dependent oxidoreductase [Pseudomonadota bacterium]
MQTFDLIIIGSGPGGYRAAVLAALRGLSVAVIEKAQWGGCCLNRGCVPKKTWHHTAKLIEATQTLAGRGLEGKMTASLAGVWRHQREVVQTVRASYTDYLKRLGVTAIAGSARFVDARTITVDGGKMLHGRHVIIATGSSPFVPPQLPRTPGRILTTDDLFDEMPPAGRRVALIGSGVASTELGYILSMLGMEVVWLARQHPLAGSRFSQPAQKALREALARRGVTLRTDSRVQGVQVRADGVLLTLPDGAQEKVDWVLLGAGRVPHTGGLAPDAAGVACDVDGFVLVNEYQQTSVSHIYAIGDVANRAMTSNHALAEATVAVANIIAPHSCHSRADSVPEAVYSALEMARLGWNEDEAEEQGREPALGFASFEANPAVLGEGGAPGFVRLVADHDSGELLGAEMAGAGAGEHMHLLAACYGEADALARLSRLAYNHPTRSEEIQNAAETLAAKWGLLEQVFGKPGNV